MGDGTPQLPTERWIEALNGQGSEIPGFALVRVSAVSDEGVLTIAQPNSDGQDVMVCGALPLPTGGTGLITRDDPVYALYDTGDGTPALGELWGAESGSYKLNKGKAGFVILGGHVDGRVLVRRMPAIDAGCHLTGGGTIAAGATSALSWSGETYDSDNMFSAGDPTKITCVTPGKYSVWFDVRGSKTPIPPAGGYHRCLIYKNGSATTHYDLRELVYATGSAFAFFCTMHKRVEMDLVAGDYLEVYWHSADDADITVTGFFGARRVA